jgi:predicted 3-demethylubiquinone-9 3-methyltransferase (glyoxalase superfamily)
MGCDEPPTATPFLWFDDQAEAAVEFYLSVFPDSSIKQVARYSEAGPGPAGSVMTIHFELDGNEFVALNGGPAHYGFDESISFVITVPPRRRSTAIGRRSPMAVRRSPAVG